MTGGRRFVHAARGARRGPHRPDEDLSTQRDGERTCSA